MPTLLPTMNARCILNLFFWQRWKQRSRRGCSPKKLNLAGGVSHSMDISFSVVERLHSAH